MISRSEDAMQSIRGAFAKAGFAKRGPSQALRFRRPRRVAQRVGAIEAVFEDGWLLFEGSLPKLELSPSGWLDLNRRMSGAAKLVAAPGARRARIRAEHPLISHPHAEESRLPARIAEIAAALDEARAIVTQRGSGAIPRSPRAAAPRPGEERDLAALCSQTGWQATARESGGVSVALDTPGDCFNALVEYDVRGALSARLELYAGPQPSALCSAAIAALLLRAGSTLRMVRGFLLSEPTVGAARESLRAGLDVQYPSQVGAEEFSEGLVALSVAARLCGRECRLLATDDRLAREYQKSTTA